MKKIDNSLYSRQLYAIGKEAMNDLSNTSVLISGMTGLGVEVAKCLILYGVKSVTLHDTGNIREKELSSNYYASGQDIGKNRTTVVEKKLADLNPYVNVTIDINEINDLHFKQHQVIIICDQLPLSQITNNKMAREYGTKFIMANTIGLFGSVFCDFGQSFTVNDINGEQLRTGTLIEIQDGTFFSSEQHQLYVGDEIEINMNGKIFVDEVTKVQNSINFSLKTIKTKYEQLIDTKFTEIKKPETFKFNTLEYCTTNPTFSNVISEDSERQQLLHDYHMALNIFINRFGRFPNCENDIYFITSLINSTNPIHKKVIRKLCVSSAGKLCPVDSIIASIAAQEVIKASTKKYIPINQWLYIDFTNTIPDSSNFQSIHQGRYSSQISIFGEQFQKKLKNSHIFIVGAGAIGCELLKNLAMMGIGKITITDMDKIEKSNLNRQFLFGYSDIGKFKSDTATNAILKMNPEINIISQQTKVYNDSLNVYTRNFFENVTCVMTALDNIEARKFVDYLCSMNTCSMIDSGTLGTKCNTQVILPEKTETYSLTQDPEEKSIPVCTLKSFPYLIEHCIQYSRDLFDGLFVKAPQNFLRYKSNPEIIKNLTKSDITEIVNDIKFINDNCVFTNKECISFAYKLWHEQFRDQIYHLITKYPENSKTKDGAPFWTGTKKFPTLKKFEKTELNIDFIKSVANLWADVFNLSHVTEKQIISFVNKTKEIPFKKPDKEITTEEEKNNTSDETSIDKLPDLSDIDYKITPLEFEKDNDENFHIDFVNSVANLRAMNYGIQRVDKFATKGIAGKIIPALITTTSLVSGLATIELIKIINEVDDSEKYINTFANLALSFFGFSEPIKAKVNRIGDLEYSLWPVGATTNPTLEKVIDTTNDAINNKSIQIMSISYFGSFIYNSLNKNHTKRLQRTIKDIMEEITEQKPPSEFLISISCDNVDNDAIIYEPILLKIVVDI